MYIRDKNIIFIFQYFLSLSLSLSLSFYLSTPLDSIKNSRIYSPQSPYRKEKERKEMIGSKTRTSSRFLKYHYSPI